MYLKLLVVLALFVWKCFLVSGSTGDERVTKYRSKILKDGPCYPYEFKCNNNQCIQKEKHCNGNYDCFDRSDENYCRVSSCSVGNLFHCGDYGKCIPNSWICDRVEDCPSGKDEKNCNYNKNEINILNIRHARKRAVEWLLKQRQTDRPGKKWGTDVRRISTALYFMEGDEFRLRRDEFIYELTIGLLSRMALKSLENISTAEIASYINSFLVTCVDPRNFEGLDLVKELRERVDLTNSTNINPYFMLTLCNAGDTITERDIEKMTDNFKKDGLDFWTDTQALTVLALACASTQPGAIVDGGDFRELTAEIKEKQYRNGTVENIKTTALVLQAVFATDENPDPDSFDEEKALEQILMAQKDDGSFGSLANTYYVLPALTFKSLVNISNTHCEPAAIGENEALLQLINLPGTKVRVQYSLWLGNNRDLERTLHIKIPAKTSFYTLMEMAADLEPRFKFEYIVKNRKPYIYSISNLQDDPESGTYWFPYTQTNGTELTPLTKSPAEVIISNQQHLIFWYKQPSYKDYPSKKFVI